MIVGVVGSGSIGPDLAYGFISALARTEGAKVYLLDIAQEALNAGMGRILGYVKKGVSRGKVSPAVGKAIEKGLIATLDVSDLADCDYVLEAATEDLSLKRKLLAQLEDVVSSECLIGFATSGIPRAHIAADAKHPERCFVNHPFFPAWRSLPIEVVLSGHEVYDDRMLRTMELLGKVPVVTADVPCFAADDVFCNYISEAARIVEEGVATPAQVDKIVNDAIGGGGPFNVMDLTRGNLLVAHCQGLMEEAPTGSPWFAAPGILSVQGNTPWHDRKSPGDSRYDEALAKEVLDRILPVVFARTYFVADNDICEPTWWNWLTRMSLGFRAGLFDLAEEYGADRVHELCTNFAARYPGFEVPKSIADKNLLSFPRNVLQERDGDVAVVSIFRPEARNALNRATMDDLAATFRDLAADDGVKGVVLTGYGGGIAGADIMELAVLGTPAAAEAMCTNGHSVLDLIASMNKPVVAALNGPALGGGAEISMACHARVVGPRLALGQPEVNLGIIPGYGGTQRLPRLIGLERALPLLRLGTPVGAKQACSWGWAHGEPAADPLQAAKDLVHAHLAGEVTIGPVDPAPMSLPDKLPPLDIGQHSLVTDAILVRTVREGLAKPLPDGLAIEAAALGECTLTVDYDIGMKNFIQNGPRVPAAFMHE
jgi:enoyl-CoA hydratase/3-hydroxyacyl-CoA dehydrogenase